MAPALEVLFVKAREAYLQDPSTINPMMEILDATKGAAGIYHGVAPEEPDTLVLFIVWDTLEEHHALMNDKASYSQLGAAFAKCADLSTANMFHVYIDNDLRAVFNAPYVSYAHISKLKQGKTNEEVLGLLEVLTDRPTPAGCHLGGYAKAVEKDEFVVLYGWDDPKFYHATREVQDVEGVLRQIRDVVEVVKRGRVQPIAYKKY